MVHDPHVSHPFSVYEATVSRILGEQTLTRSSAPAANNVGHSHGFVATEETPTTNSEEFCGAAYAKKGNLQVCFPYRINNTCTYGNNCSRDHTGPPGRNPEFSDLLISTERMRLELSALRNNNNWSSNQGQNQSQGQSKQQDQPHDNRHNDSNFDAYNEYQYEHNYRNAKERYRSRSNSAERVRKQSKTQLK
jgi:hypothetical protein